jgi:predicted nucleotidyltransferase
MAAKDVISRLEAEFDFLKGTHGVLAVLLFGSEARDKKTGRDSDICIVAPAGQCSAVMAEVYRRMDTGRKKYDVYCFEELPLYMRWEIIGNHKIIWARDKGELYEYFYYFRKLYDDQKHRMKVAKKEIFSIMDAHNQE